VHKGFAGASVSEDTFSELDDADDVVLLAELLEILICSLETIAVQVVKIYTAWNSPVPQQVHLALKYIISPCPVYILPVFRFMTMTAMMGAVNQWCLCASFTLLTLLPRLSTTVLNHPSLHRYTCWTGNEPPPSPVGRRQQATTRLDEAERALGINLDPHC